MTDHHIHPDPAVRALVERAKAEALREAADVVNAERTEHLISSTRAPAAGPLFRVEQRLRARADSLAAQPAPEAATIEGVVTKNDAAHPFVPIVRRAVLQWKGSGGDVSVVIAQALADEHREAMARAWDEGWDDRDNDSSEPYSPHKVNPYRHTPPGSPEEKP